MGHQLFTPDGIRDGNDQGVDQRFPVQACIRMPAKLEVKIEIARPLLLYDLRKTPRHQMPTDSCYLQKLGKILHIVANACTVFAENKLRNISHVVAVDDWIFTS